MIYCLRVSALDLNHARDGLAARHAHLRSHQWLATVACPFGLTYAITADGSTCRSLILN